MGSIKSRKVNYSPKENKLLRLLPEGKLISSIELTKKLESNSYNAQQSTVALMSSLIKKLNHNMDIYKIEKSPRSGPNPMEYRKVKR